MSAQPNPLSVAPTENQDHRTVLVGLSRDEMITAFADLGEKAFRAKQVWQWIYHHGVTDFAQMSNIGKGLREKLAAHFVIGRPGIVQDLRSSDGTAKWLMRFPDGQEAETVHIPEDDRGTLCISSQVGCTLNCRFCHTGTQMLVRNLEAAEILGQLMHARDALEDWRRPGEERLISNIVMMGMGEPLYNFENVKKALKIMTDNEGISISKRRITLSTAGVVPLMERCGAEIGVNLAVSLHAVRDDIRDEIVPLNRKYPIAQVLQACRDYPGVHNARRITFEYVMLKDINDSDADARELVRLLKDIPAKVNLIPFNAWPGAPYDCSSPERITRFSDIVFQSGISAPVRKPRGEDILAACGQLKSASLRLRKHGTPVQKTPSAEPGSLAL